jgi:HEPN domain-containing protein
VPPDRPGEQLAEANRWLRQAHDDLFGARAMLDRDDVAPRLACFLAQQAAEKAFKARLTALAKAFPRVHDLITLRSLLPDDSEAGAEAADLATLTVWAVEARYPGDLAEASRADAITAVTVATAVVESARSAVPAEAT